MPRSKRSTMEDWEVAPDLAQELEHAVEELTWKLSQYLNDGEVDGEPDWEPPSGYPYCGCSTCEARELLTVIVPIVAQGCADGLVTKPTTTEEE